MAIHWQVKFKSLRADELYTVNIYDDNYYGNPIQLTGAAHPFVTQESNPDDMFATVLTQSGYLRIVDTGKDGAGNTFDWREFIPTTDIDRPITLTDSLGNVKWQGFMQAQSFGSTMFELPQEREFPVQCPLTVLSKEDISVANKNIHNFAYLLLEIVDSIPSVCRPNMFYFQGASATTYLQKQIDWQNFAKIEDDEIAGQYDLFSVLQQMCKFWGWTARMHHDAMYFVSPDVTDSNIIEVRYSDLLDIANETSFYVQNIDYADVILGSDIFASTSNTDFQMRGPNMAKITANNNEAGSDVISLYPNNVIEQMDAGGNYQEQYGNGLRAFFSDDLTEFEGPLLVGRCASNTESFNIMEIAEGSGFSPQGEKRSTFNTIRIRQTYNGNVLVSLETVFEHTFNGLRGFFSFGGISITGDIYRQGERYEYADETTGAGLSHIYFRIGIGTSRETALWYNGSSWTNSVVSCLIEVGGTRRQGFYLGIATDNPDLRGRMYIDILGSDDMRHEASSGYIDRMEIVDLNVSFVRSLDGNKESSREYVAHNNNMVKEEHSDDAIFATDNDLKYGYALIMNPDGTMFKGIDYDGNNTLIPPEQRLAERIVDYWATSKRKMEVELLANKEMQTGNNSEDAIVNLSPGMKTTLDGTGVYPISISHNWRDDVVQAVLMELGTNTPPTPGRLPAGYTELAWINDNGTGYLNTGYVPVGDEVFEIDAIMTEAPSSGYAQIMGCRVGASATSETNCWLGISSSNILTNRIGTVNPSGSISITANNIYHISVDLVNCMTTANSEQYTFPGSDVSEITLSVYLFRVHTSGSALARKGKLTISSFIVKRGNVKQLELVPAMRDSDNVVGMYDLVSNTFLTNAGSGTFNYGTL